jgi:hypothetical protein
MPTDLPGPILCPASPESRKESLDQQVRFEEQRILKLEQQLLDVERELVDVEHKLEENRESATLELILNDRNGKAQSRVEILEAITAAKKEVDVLKSKLVFVG